MKLITRRITGGCIIGTNNENWHNAVSQEDFESIIGPISIPYSYNGLKVIKIGQFAFSHCHRLTHVQINAAIQSIGSSAFVYCYNLVSINIPASVQIIERSALGLGNSSRDNIPSSSGTLTVNIEAHSKLKYLDYHAICCKNTINIYYCGSHVVQSDEQSVTNINNLSIFSINGVNFANHKTTISPITCVPQNYSMPTCYNCFFFLSYLNPSYFCFWIISIS